MIHTIYRRRSDDDARIHLHPSRPRWRLWMEHSFAEEVKSSAVAFLRASNSGACALHSRSQSLRSLAAQARKKASASARSAASSAECCAAVAGGADWDCVKAGLMKVAVKARKHNDKRNANDIEHPSSHIIESNILTAKNFSYRGRLHARQFCNIHC